MKKITSLLILSLFLVIVTSCGSKKRTGTPEEQIVSAVCDNDLEAVKELLKNGVSANTRDKGYNIDESAPIMYFAAQGTFKEDGSRIEHIEIVKLLVENGAEINFLHEKVMSPLMTAIQGNNIETVKFLLESGADLDLWVFYTGSFLKNANKFGHTEITEILKSYGAKE